MWSARHHPGQCRCGFGDRRSPRKLTALGCQVQVVSDRDALTTALKDREDRVVFLDAPSLGDAGPDLVGLINHQTPAVRVVVVAAGDDRRETAYRKHRILYYAVEPFADGEMADILAAAFQPHEAPPVDRQKGPSEPISSIVITNRNGHRVQLLAAPGLMWRNEGLGLQIGQKLLAQMLPVVMTPGVANLSSGQCSQDRGHRRSAHGVAGQGQRILLPGCLARDTKPDFGVRPRRCGRQGHDACPCSPTPWVALPDWMPAPPAALADHIVREMAVY